MVAKGFAHMKRVNMQGGTRSNWNGWHLMGGWVFGWLGGAGFGWGKRMPVERLNQRLKWFPLALYGA